MHTVAKIALAVGFIGAMALSTNTPVAAQGFYFDAPGIHIGAGPRHHRYWNHRYYDYYPGPAYNGGWDTWNGCPPNYTIQDGFCKPYRGY